MNRDIITTYCQHIISGLMSRYGLDMDKASEMVFSSSFGRMIKDDKEEVMMA